MAESHPEIGHDSGLRSRWVSSSSLWDWPCGHSVNLTIHFHLM